MVKSLLSILFLSLFAIGTPVSARINSVMELIEIDTQTISISVVGSKVRVNGANGLILSVYNVTGVRVMRVRVDSVDKVFDLALPKGCYILKVGKTVRKISIR